MAMTINTNVLSLITQNNLNKSQNALSGAIQDLSSGMKINSAADNAAGFAIATRFTSQINGLTQAQSNANDGISLTQTTEGALTQVTANLQNIRDLAVQAANGTNSASDLQSIQTAITQSLAEINRTSQQTSFNGNSVLGAGATTANIQVGANDGQTIAIALQQINSSTLGLTGFNVNGTGTANAAATASDLTSGGYVKGSTINGTTAYARTYTAADNASLATVIGKAVSGDTVTDGSVYTSTGTGYSYGDVARTAANVTSDLKPAAGGSTNVTIKIGGTTTNANIDSNGNLTNSSDGKALYLDGTGNLTETSGGTLAQANVNGAVASATLATDVAGGDLLGSMGKASAGTGGTITVGSGAAPATYSYTVGTATAAATNLSISNAALATKVQTDNKAGTAIAATLGGTGYSIAAGSGAGTGTVTATTGGAQVNIDNNGALTTNTAQSLYVQANGTVTDGSANTVYDDSANAGKFTLNTTSGTTSTANPLAKIDAALAIVSALNSSLGAVQNRLQSAISTAQSMTTNLSSSRSHIQDADYAVEVSAMTTAQIEQQAGTAVLKQANSTAQGVMSLLQ